MLDEVNKALETYGQKWQSLTGNRTDKDFFETLKPTAIGWKVTDRTEYDRVIADLHDQADHIVEVWMNGRWIAKVHLKDTKLTNGVEILKVMERRPDSTDAVGLDHVDFYTSIEPAQCEKLLTAETDLKWSKETNDVIAGYGWLSVWFDGTEAKIKSDTVLDIIRAELTELNKKILA